MCFHRANLSSFSDWEGRLVLHSVFCLVEQKILKTKSKIGKNILELIPIFKRWKNVCILFING